MTLKTLIVGAIVTGSWVASPSRAQVEEVSEPYEWVRTLEAAQMQIGQGNRTVHENLPRLLTEIAERILNAEDELLSEPRNARALVAFVLSGGDGAVLRRLLSLGGIDPQQEKLARGALAYTEAKFSEANEHLREINAKDLPPSLAGRVALVQAILSYKTDLNAAIKMLDISRLLGVGTLVEEAALRRQVVLLSAAKEQDRFERLAHQYFRRFKQSVYADYFKEQFSVAAAGFDYGPDSHRLERLQSIVEVGDTQDRGAFYVLIAEKAIFVGNLPLTEFASSRALQGGVSGLQKVRAELYGACAAVAGGDTSEAVTRLRSIPVSSLDSNDEGLLWAALSVADEVMRPPSRSESAPDVSPIHVSSGAPLESVQAASDADRDGAQDGPFGGILEAARKSIAQADKLLEMKRQGGQ